MRHLFLITCLMYALVGKAQYDNSAFLNGMNAYYEGMSVLNQYQNQLMDLYKQYNKQQQDNLFAVLSYIPGYEEDQFSAVITLSGMYGHLVRITYTPLGGSAQTLKSARDYLVTGQRLVVIKPLLPGSTLTVSRTDNAKQLCKQAIPRKSETAYVAFVLRAKQSVAAFSNLNVPDLRDKKTNTTPSKPLHHCQACKGTGVCGTCNGRGVYLNSYTSDYIRCPNCSENNKHRCSVCNGTGRH